MTDIIIVLVAHLIGGGFEMHLMPSLNACDKTGKVLITLERADSYVCQVTL